MAKVDDRVFISGQIGLIPSSLTLPSPPSLGLETALACQHAERISKSVREATGDWGGHAQLIVYWHSNVVHAMQARRVLLDLVRLFCLPNVVCAQFYYQKPSQDEFACTLFIVVKELPKSAMIEKQVVMHTGRIYKVDPDDGTICVESRRSVFSEGEALLSSRPFEQS